jgi:hypothetical protein
MNRPPDEVFLTTVGGAMVGIALYQAIAYALAHHGVQLCPPVR